MRPKKIVKTRLVALWCFRIHLLGVASVVGYQVVCFELKLVCQCGGQMRVGYQSLLKDIL